MSLALLLTGFKYSMILAHFFMKLCQILTLEDGISHGEAKLIIIKKPLKNR